MSKAERWKKKLIDREYKTGDRIIGLFSGKEGTIGGSESATSSYNIRYKIAWDDGGISHNSPYDFTTKDDPFYHRIQWHVKETVRLGFCALSVGKDDQNRLRVVYHHGNMYTIISEQYPKVRFKWTWHLNIPCLICDANKEREARGRRR